MGSNASYIWKSLYATRDVLKEGLFWRIGNGKSVVIGQDKWIPQASTYQIQSPLHDRIRNSRVSELIDAESRSWNLALVSDVFSQSEANIISKIPVCPCNSPDKLIWRGTKDGKFTVKSAYHFLSQMKDALAGQCSYSNSQNEVWGKIWRIKVPNACKMFLWRATHESLPTNLNLSRRKIRESPLCPICHQEEESVVHVLWMCVAAQDVWGSSSRKFQKMAFHPLHCKDLVCHLFSTLTDEEMEVFTATVHIIWKRRNSFVFEDKFEDPATISRNARHLVMEYKRVLSLPVGTNF